jgi:CRISPR-associated protein Csm1
MEKEIMRHKIYLAGLLHDIGKFWQRADDAEDFQQSSILNQSIKNNTPNLSAVTQDGFVKYAHSAYTQQFLENFETIFNNFFNDKSDKDDNFVNIAIYHHNPKTFHQELIQLADWWSSGIDRQKQYEKQELEKDYRSRPLNNIFKNLKVYDKNFQDINTSSDNFNFSLNKLSLKKDVLFSQVQSNTSQGSYKALWNLFIDDFKKIPLNNFRVFSDTLYYLLQSYLWCLPASTLKKEVHDSNLFEHSKTTAAIALCLYDYCFEKQITETKKINEDHRPVSLVSIDISGIQSFIYNISSKGAAKALKGRSFYLQLLMDTIINEILYDLDYYRSNVLYSSGGKAYLLLPNIEKVNNGLKDYQEKLERWLFEKFNGDLYVSIGKADFYFDRENREGEGENGKKYLINDEKEYKFIGDLWKRALEDASKVKYQRFKSVIRNDSSFFEPFGTGGDIEVCDLTGVELNNENKFILDENQFHVSVGEQIELGRILKEATYFAWTNIKDIPNNVVNSSCYNFKNKEKSLKILDSQWFFYDEERKPSSIDDTIVYKSVKIDFNFDQHISGNSVKAFRFYAGSTEISAFGDLVDKHSEFKRLAAFVMDVDNLGKIFIDGFKEKNNNGEVVRDNSSFSRLSSLSFYLDLFFSGYVNVIKEKYPKIMVVYAGGDDLLAVGDWKEIIRFAEDVRNEFYEFVCNRSEISFSAGIHLFQEKFPISKAVDSAKEAEKVAKSFNNNEKGNICYLNTSLVWKKINANEFDRVRKIKENFVRFHQEEIINSAFLQRFQQFYEAKRQSQKTNNLSYRWNIAYYLKRFNDKIIDKKNKDFAEFMEEIYKELRVFINEAKIDLMLSERNYDLYALAARWAELELRSEPKKNEVNHV